MTRLLTGNDIAMLLARTGPSALVRAAITRLHDALVELGAGRLDPTPARTGFRREAGDLPGVIELMPHRQSGSGVTVKTVSYAPCNPHVFGLPTIVGTVGRFDDNSGRLTAIMDAALLTAVRTAAASAVASRLLADPGSRVLGMIGAGTQAVVHAHALSEVFEVEEILVHDTDPGRRASFRDRLKLTDPVVRVAGPAEIAERSDIVTTATSTPPGSAPTLRFTRSRPWLHVNAVGSDEPGKTELPRALLEAAFVCVDHPEQARTEGESQQIPDRPLGPTLAELCCDPGQAIRRRSELTVFDSTGFAFEDHVMVDLFIELAADLGLGTEIELADPSEEPHDPYAAVSPFSVNSDPLPSW